MWCPTLVGEENKPPFIRVWKPSRLEGKRERESPKKTISISCGFGPLQIVLELDIGRCANLLVVSRRGKTWGGVPVRLLGLKGGGFKGGPTLIGGWKECQRWRWPRRGVHCDVPCYKGVETFPPVLKSRGKSPKRTISVSSRFEPLQRISPARPVPRLDTPPYQKRKKK